MTKRQRLIEDLASRLMNGLRDRTFTYDKLGLALEQLADCNEFTVLVDEYAWGKLSADVLRRVNEKRELAK